VSHIASAQNVFLFEHDKKVVEQVGEVHVEAVADGDDGGKSDAAAGGPLHQTGGDRTRLRDPREVAGRRSRAAKLALSLMPGTSTPRQLGPIRRMPAARAFFSATAAKRTGTVSEPCGDDDADGRAFARSVRNRIGQGGRRHGDGDDIGRHRQRIVGFGGANAGDLVITRIDQVNRAREPAGENIFEHGAAY
jgi:hypothetical protein